MGIDERFGLNRNSYFYAGLNIVELVGLCIIGFATTFAIGQETWSMIETHKVSLSDLLLLFLYLEVLAMVGQYFKTGQIQVRYPIYIAIVALARVLIVEAKTFDNWHLIAVAGTIVLLAIAVLIVRYGHVRYPYKSSAKGELAGD
jgi:protein PsiE